MDKLIIAGRANSSNGFYIKFKADKRALVILNKILVELGSDGLIDDCPDIFPRLLSNYSKWKDQWIPIVTKDRQRSEVNIICGNKMVHMLVRNCQNYNRFNRIFEKYCVWAKPKKFLKKNIKKVKKR